jgi:SAM-dependent methyltransferase
MSNSFYISNNELHELLRFKKGNLEKIGGAPARRLKFNYFQPSEYYEALVNKLVTESTSWVDVGGGSAIFPHNDKLSRSLADRCKVMYAVDPSDNVYDNPYALEKIKSMFEDVETDTRFDLATFRMVAEHVSNTDAVIAKLREVMKPEGVVVIYTINRYSPIPIITYFTPFSLHYRIKKFFWGGEEKDTFPVQYKMNTRNDLARIFSDGQFSEVYFDYLDDLSTFSRFRNMNYLELSFWKFLKKFSIRYPENNLLGVYKKIS